MGNAVTSGHLSSVLPCTKMRWSTRISSLLLLCQVCDVMHGDQGDCDRLVRGTLKTALARLTLTCHLHLIPHPWRHKVDGHPFQRRRMDSILDEWQCDVSLLIISRTVPTMYQNKIDCEGLSIIATHPSSLSCHGQGLRWLWWTSVRCAFVYICHLCGILDCATFTFFCLCFWKLFVEIMDPRCKSDFW